MRKYRIKTQDVFLIICNSAFSIFWPDLTKIVSTIMITITATIMINQRQRCDNYKESDKLIITKTVKDNVKTILSTIWNAVLISHFDITFSACVSSHHSVSIRRRCRLQGKMNRSKKHTFVLQFCSTLSRNSKLKIQLYTLTQKYFSDRQTIKSNWL